MVADEVRNLAQRCAQSAKETADKIEAAVGNTAQGVAITDKVAKTLAEIVDKARQVDTLVAEVASASQEQTSGIDQINTAVGQMDKVTQSNAANAEECAASAEEMNAQAATMKDAVGELMKLVGGTSQVNKTPQTTLPAAPLGKPSRKGEASTWPVAAPMKKEAFAKGQPAEAVNDHFKNF